MRFPSSRVVCSSAQQMRRIPCGIFWSYQHSHVSTPRGGGWWWWRAGWVRKRVAETRSLYTGDYNIFGCGNKREKRTREKEKTEKKNKPKHEGNKTRKVKPRGGRLKKKKKDSSRRRSSPSNCQWRHLPPCHRSIYNLVFCVLQTSSGSSRGTLRLS